VIRESVRSIAEDDDRESWRRHVDEKQFPTEYWQDLAANGSLGGGLRAVDLAVEYANEREVVGQPVGAHQAIQTHGHNGFTREYDVFVRWHNARLSRTAPVSNEIATHVMAEHHLGLPRSHRGRSLPG
jgi:alkylation response protein AidB-like acyl-CoA dehydrogenase